MNSRILRRVFDGATKLAWVKYGVGGGLKLEPVCEDLAAEFAQTGYQGNGLVHLDRGVVGFFGLGDNDQKRVLEFFGPSAKADACGEEGG